MPDDEQATDRAGIGERLRFIRKHHPDGKMTVAQLAAKSGVSPRLIADVEAGNANPTVQKLESITRAMGITRVAYLLDAAVFDHVNAKMGITQEPRSDGSPSPRQSPDDGASPAQPGRARVMMRKVANMDEQTFELLERLVDVVTKPNTEGT